jgi:hypothetical protein
MLYYTDTMQHKAIKLMANKLAVAGIIEGGFSEEGLAAMSQCDDMTSQMAKELMLGIKDSVEDVSAAFKRMSFAKRKENPLNTPIFTDKPVEIRPAVNDTPTLVEFTFIAPAVIPKVTSVPVPADIFQIVPRSNKRMKPAVDENQLSFLEFTA